MIIIFFKLEIWNYVDFLDWIQEIENIKLAIAINYTHIHSSSYVTNLLEISCSIESSALWSPMYMAL